MSDFKAVLAKAEESRRLLIKYSHLRRVVIRDEGCGARSLRVVPTLEDLRRLEAREATP